MAKWEFFVLVAFLVVYLDESDAGVISRQPVSFTTDAYGNPVIFLREKRTPMRPYQPYLPFPQRTMMFTSYYRPIRHSYDASQASSVFAQGNSISGPAPLGGRKPPYLSGGPEPITEPEITSSETEAPPVSNGPINENDQRHHEFHHQGNDRRQQGQDRDDSNRRVQGHRDEDDKQKKNHEEDSPSTNIPEEDPVDEPPRTKASVDRSKPRNEKGKKTPIPVDDEEDEEDEEYEDDEDTPMVPFIPPKGGKRRQYYPNLNNFFPMVFSFPGMSSRSDTSGSVPGAVTAIANSYSTAKGGVASSVATVYGGQPNGKKRRYSSSEE